MDQDGVDKPIDDGDISCIVTEKESLQRALPAKHKQFKSTLKETTTFQIYSLQGTLIPKSSSHYKRIQDENVKYENACRQQRKEYPNKYIEHEAQTFHLYLLNQATQTHKKLVDVGVGVGDEEEKTNDIIAENFVEELVTAALVTQGTLLDVSEGIRPSERASKSTASRSALYSDIIISQAKTKFFALSSVATKLALLERAIQQNLYANLRIKYRGILSESPVATLATKNTYKSADEGITMELLLGFQCGLTSDMKVNCLSWNKAIRDLLTVGYGCRRNSHMKNGFVMLWSIRNPGYPEKLFKFDSSVTAIEFSTKDPEMLAVGLSDGRVLLFDIATQQNLSSSLLDSEFAPGRHMSAVSDLNWVVDKHKGTSEKLISLSIDGRVLQWTCKKGFSASPLITLKRSDNNLSKGKLPNTALGLSMDILPDGITYLTGCDDGSLQHCSLSYHDHPLTVKKAHNGSITAIQVSPFQKHFVLTSSADSTVKIHNIDQKLQSITEILTIHPSGLIGAINDISWYPLKPSVFALVTQDNRLELWDVCSSSLTPILNVPQYDKEKNQKKSIERTVVAFSNLGDVVAVGDDRGCIELYSVHLEERLDNCAKNDIFCDWIK